MRRGQRRDPREGMKSESGGRCPAERELQTEVCPSSHRDEAELVRGRHRHKPIHSRGHVEVLEVDRRFQGKFL